MKTFIFYQKNSSMVISVSAPTFDEAETELFATVNSTYGWRCDDVEGEDYED